MFIFSIIIFLILVFMPLLALYFSLDVGQDPKEADVIIGPEGPSPERSKKTSQLLSQGYSKSGKLIVTAFFNKDKHTDYRERYFKQLAIPADQIIQENQATSTYTNAVYALKIMKEKDYQSALIVSSDYHIRRVKWSFDQVNQDYGFDLSYCSAYAQDENGEELPYWKDPKNSRLALEEVVKNIGYWLRLYRWIDL